MSTESKMNTSYWIHFVFLIFASSDLHFVAIVNSSESWGKYYIDYKEIKRCDKDMVGSNQMQLNLRLTKKNKKTEVTGNFTLEEVWDDTCSIHVHILKGDSKAGWISNVFQTEIPGCKSLITLIGENSNEFFNSMNISSICPLEKGVYEQKGFDVDKLFKTRLFPPEYFYGRYKFITSYKKQKKVIGCSYYIYNLIPLRKKP